MIIRFWGVRGSLPAPGSSTTRVGGNTACVSIAAGDQILVLDGGSGIRGLGRALLGRSTEITLLTSHRHLDHLIGIPFFAPLYEEGRKVNLIPIRTEGEARSPLELLDGTYSPRRQSELPASVNLVEDEYGFLEERGFQLRCFQLDHPGGSTGFRIERDSSSLVYMTDNELGQASAEWMRFAEFAGFAREADLLCHDAQFTAAEIEAKRGWGHSTVEEACQLAIEAEVGHLVLFHHDPDRSDEEVASLEATARYGLEPHGIQCTAAYEGLELKLGD